MKTSLQFEVSENKLVIFFPSKFTVALKNIHGGGSVVSKLRKSGI